MGSRTRFFGTVLAILALNSIYYSSTLPSRNRQPTDPSPATEQLKPLASPTNMLQPSPCPSGSPCATVSPLASP